MSRLHTIAIILMSAVAVNSALAATPAKKSKIWLAYERAERYGNMGNLVYKANVDARWVGDTHQFWYRNDVRGKSEWVLIDADTGKRTVYSDPSKLPKSTTPAVPTSPGRGRRQQGPPPERRENPASPDGKWTASIKDHNILLQRPDGWAKPLTTDGTDKIAYVRVNWSPDSKRLVAWKTEFGDNLPVYTIESAPADSLRPKLHTDVYALPGDKLDIDTLFIVDIDSGKITPAATDPVTYGDVPDIRWLPDTKSFTFEQTDRAYKRVRVMKVDSVTGASETIIEETSRTFVFPPCEANRYLDSTNELIWPSERDGWCHLYLYDLVTGQFKNRITKGDWVVRNIDSVDEKSRTIIFTAGGREPGQDPYLIHYYRANLDGTGLVCLTPGNGQHMIRWSPDKAYYIDSYSRVDVAPVTELRRASDASLVCEIERADTKDLLATGWKMPEPFVAKGRDGKTDIYGVIIRPSKIDPNRKYPVIEDIYAGPQSSFVPKTFSANRGNQALAELGFIVVHIDGMGTGNRSKAFQDVCYKNLGDSGFPDRIAWMKAAAARYPYMGLTRVGIHGMSAGGYNAAHALLAHPEFYKVGVAMSGNHDHRTDKVWWNELWMGYPVGEHYAEQSNMTMAGNLVGKLLIMAGDLDDNVNPSAATLQFANALIKANKDFDMLIIPGMKHAIIPYETCKMWNYYVRNLLGIDPPANYSFQNAPGAECTVTIRNLLTKPVEIYWVAEDGKLTKYPDVGPGQSAQRHTFIGHQWQAQIEGKVVSSYTASARALEWVIAEE